jgi:hypothetical protein
MSGEERVSVPRHALPCGSRLNNSEPTLFHFEITRYCGRENKRLAIGRLARLLIGVGAEAAAAVTSLAVSSFSEGVSGELSSSVRWAVGALRGSGA